VEHFMPIYPGMIVAAAMTGLPLGTLAILHLPFSIIMTIVGYFFFLRKIDRGEENGLRFGSALKGIFSTIWPVILTIAVYALADIEMAWGAVVALIVLVVVARPKLSTVWKSVRKGLSYKLVFLVFGILSFQTVLDQSGAVGAIKEISTQYNFPEPLIIIIVAFISGLLTGMLAALVALSYSLLAGFLFQPIINMDYILLAFLSGYVGMMVSPSHLCLVLTNEYFGSELPKVFRILVPPLAILALAGFLVYLAGWGQLLQGLMG
ncbi:MAG: DUF401 family protein, partial [candidate division Zixibacteria bacterium]